MAIFNGHIITDAGRNLLGRALAGEGKIIITRGALGEGKITTQNLREMTSLIDERLTANVSDLINDRGTVNLKLQLSNSNLSRSFRTEEFGIFAKIEGDKNEVLYSYCNAIESDVIPNNSFGDTFLQEHTVYIAFSSDAEADIYIKEGAVFLTLETANKNYINTGLVVEGKLSSGRTMLHSNYQYQADNGKWYINVGGERAWTKGNGTPDNLLVEISYFNLHQKITELDNKGLYPRKTLSGVVNLDNVVQQGLYDCSNLDKSSFTGYSGNYYSFGTFEVLVDNAGNITQKYIPHYHTGNVLLRQKYYSGVWTGWRAYESSNAIDKRIGTLPTSIDTSEKIFKALQGNVGIKFDDKLLYLNDAGTKRVGYCYLDKLKDGIFECISTTTSTVNNSSYFKNLSSKENSDRLDNLTGLKTLRTTLPPKSEITLERGFYIFTHYHTGILSQNFVTFVSLYDYERENRWVKMTSLIPEHNATENHINFEYNPYLLKIRNTTEHNRNVELLKFV